VPERKAFRVAFTRVGREQRPFQVAFALDCVYQLMTARFV
jgi:hypothetical protein